MRRLMWFTIGFAAACGVGTTLLWTVSLTPLAVYAVICGLICFAIRRKGVAVYAFSMLLLGIGCGISWLAAYKSLYLAPLEKIDGESFSASVTITGYSEKTDYGCSVDALAFFDGKPYTLRVYQKGSQQLTPGTVLEASFKFRLTTPNGQKDSSYYRGKSIFLVASQKDEGCCGQSQLCSIIFLPAKAKKAALNHIKSCFPSDTAAFAKALLLGDTSDLSYETDTALKGSGIRHVVAVSGLHVSALFGAVYFVFRRKRLLTLLISAPLLFFFAAVTGFSPSVTRAVLMSTLMALGAVINREYDGLTSLSFACLVMLFLNPFVIYSVSFQLSVLSVAGILIASPPCRARMMDAFRAADRKGNGAKILRTAASSISVSAGAMLFTAPLCAYYFQCVSLIGMAANLLIIWVIPLLFCGTAVIAILGGVLHSLCTAAASILSVIIRGMLAAANALSEIPFGAVYTQSVFITVWLIGIYCLIALYIVRKKGGKWILAAGIAGLFAAISLSVIVPRLDDVRLNVLDVGEGQSILIQSRGRNFLIDCGGDSDTKVADEAAQTLLSQGIFRLDGIILTHYDRDHVNGLENLLSRVSASHFYLPDVGDTAEVQALTQRSGAELTWIKAESSFDIALPCGKLTLLMPKITNTDNENSMCVLFESEKCVILVTGDRGSEGERELLYSYNLPDVDILIAGHHGSKKSTTDALLRAVRPEMVIISVGENNRYGHPAQDVLDRLARFGCEVYRTDLQGAVLIRR